MILNLISVSLLVSSSALTLPQKVVPASPVREVHHIHALHDSLSKEKVQETKETTFSFTREVLHAWTPGHSAIVPRLQFAAVVSPDLGGATSPKLQADQSSALPNLKVDAASTRHGFAYDAAIEIAKQTRQLRSVKTGIDTANVQKTISQAPLLSPKITDLASPEEVVRIYVAHDFMTKKNHTQEVLDTRNGTGHMLEFVPPVAYHAAGISEKKADVICMLFVVAVVVLVSCCVAVFADFDSSDYGIEQKSLGHSSSHTTLKTLAEMLEALEKADGTWAQNYKVAEGKRKMALELVFRCSIIPEPEFAHSRVSQEHIDECIWIAVNMLKKRSVEEWVDKWLEARVTFNESVTACFQARTELMDPAQPSSLSSRHAPSPAYNQAFSPPRQHSQEEAVLSKDSDGQNLLVVRCREIMANQLAAKRSRSPGSESPQSPKSPQRSPPHP